MDEELSVSLDLRYVLARAAQITHALGEDRYDLTFTSVLVAFLVSPGAVSDWFKRYILGGEANANVERLLGDAKLNQSSIVEFANRSMTEYLQNVEKFKAAPDFEGILKNARGLLSNVQRTVDERSKTTNLATRHMMGAYIYMPAGHERDLERWDFNPPHWSNSFLDMINRNNPEELLGWIEEHRRAFKLDPEILSENLPEGDRVEGEPIEQERSDISSGRKPVQRQEDEIPLESEAEKTVQPEPEPEKTPPATPTTPPLPEGEGPSPHIATDRWTVEDALGYRSYAYAIYRFLTHENTSPPLTVSIQAPWGGGKTSLMRMVQAYLDPDSPDQMAKRSPEEAAQVPPGEAEPTSPLPTGELTLGQLLDEIEAWISTRTKQPLPSADLPWATDSEQYPRRLTVWFNAWKYESTDQVWAGLADALLQQVASRMRPAEREVFWFRLNLKRIDTDKLRLQVHQRIVNTFWQKSLPWIWGSGVALLAFVLAALGGWLAQSDAIRNLGALGFMISALGSGLVLISRYLETEQAAKKEPASVSLSEYLTVPNYRAQLSFIHQVDKDLRDVFACIPANYLPIVVFVDDLDRCSPEKVAEVVEGVNLFLAGDFPVCMFVLGMDPEMVAAALEAAHEKMIARLPKDASTPVGWRFMDKFVQLPFVIPPPTPKNLEDYTEALFSVSQKVKLDTGLRDLLHQLTQAATSEDTLATETERLLSERQISEERAELVRQQVQEIVEIRKQEKLLDAGIESFNDQDEKIRAQIRKAAKSFSHNPRELKRFINAMRFNYYLLWTCVVRGYGQEITLDQLQRWVVLSMKWPEVVRWIRRSGGRESPGGVPAQADNGRLRLLEELGQKSPNLQLWQQNARSDLDLDPNNARWLHDDDLRQFFEEEGALPQGERLSDAAGKGLW